MGFRIARPSSSEQQTLTEVGTGQAMLRSSCRQLTLGSTSGDCSYHLLSFTYQYGGPAFHPSAGLGVILIVLTIWTRLLTVELCNS